MAKKTKSTSKEYLSVSVHLRVNGKLKRFQRRTYYQRGRETYCFTLDDFARTIFMWDKMFSPHATYAYDGLLQEMEKKLPKESDETAESLFKKYWVNYNQTANEQFLELNKGDEDSLFPAEGDFLLYSIANQIKGFSSLPLPIKYGFLYWFFKYQMNSSTDEILADFNNTPKQIRDLVESMIKKD